MTRLAIIGAGDLGQLLAHHAPACAEVSIAGFFDDLHAPGARVDGHPVLGGLAGMVSAFERGLFDAFVMGIGYRHLAFRGAFFRTHAARVPAVTLVHPSCVVDASARLGPGTVLLPGCALDRNVEIGANCLLNTGCTIAHDVRVVENAFLGPNVTLAGFATVRPGVFLGVSTTVIDRVTIHPGVRTGAGAVVIDDLVEPGLYVGVPARRKA